MKGYLPQDLGYWLWMNLKEESTVHMWFAMCSHKQQEYMRSHYIAYMRGIKEDGYLGHTWQMKMNATYENQSFHQMVMKGRIQGNSSLGTLCLHAC